MLHGLRPVSCGTPGGASGIGQPSLSPRQSYSSGPGSGALVSPTRPLVSSISPMASFRLPEAAHGAHNQQCNGALAGADLHFASAMEKVSYLAKSMSRRNGASGGSAGVGMQTPRRGSGACQSYGSQQAAGAAASADGVRGAASGGGAIAGVPQQAFHSGATHANTQCGQSGVALGSGARSPPAMGGCACAAHSSPLGPKPVHPLLARPVAAPERRFNGGYDARAGGPGSSPPVPECYSNTDSPRHSLNSLRRVLNHQSSGYVDTAGGDIFSRATSSVPEASMRGTEQRVRQVQEKIKGLNAMLQEQQSDPNGALALRERVLSMATALTASRRERKDVEAIMSRLRARLHKERSEREAWLRAFKDALKKTLSDLTSCIDTSVKESGELMRGRLDEAEVMMGKLIGRMDDIFSDEFRRPHGSALGVASGTPGTRSPSMLQPRPQRLEASSRSRLGGGLGTDAAAAAAAAAATAAAVAAKAAGRGGEGSGSSVSTSASTNSTSLGRVSASNDGGKAQVQLTTLCPKAAAERAAAGRTQTLRGRVSQAAAADPALPGAGRAASREAAARTEADNKELMGFSTQELLSNWTQLLNENMALQKQNQELLSRRNAVRESGQLRGGSRSPQTASSLQALRSPGSQSPATASRLAGRLGASTLPSVLEGQVAA
eukprot:TRINITY_DN13251_c0_g1_i2.p1 TRINITY_DN13251_c0_g1~~TRINITY_DN13251_c0_g1_i2.p1  ORF type:complete len:665 (+),score=128.38 TRINITY_DN13251_c0_g1_i2:151-2145(+)